MRERITYKTSGVNIDKANVFVEAIKKDMKSTFTPAVLNRTGAFSSLFELDLSLYKNLVIASSTDGVGTKLLIAKQVGKHDTVGIDLVGMNVNDVLCVGAKPLFFLDYIACGKVRPAVFKDVVKGIAAGCRESGMSLIGGETAEMPGMYKEDEYDLAGFAVGVVEKDKIIDGSRIEAGDRVIGLPSSGLHSNGYSLVRKVLGPAGVMTMARELLTPTRIYVRDVLPLVAKFNVRGIAHMTGGAYFEKLTKILPAGKCFVINRRSWPVPKIFQIIQKKGKIDDHEMYRTFNMGIGLALVFSTRELSLVKGYLEKKKILYYEIGQVINDPKRKIIL